MQWFLDRLGQPVPCSLCRRPLPVREMRERWMTGTITDVVPGCGISPRIVVWLCPACPG